MNATQKTQKLTNNQKGIIFGLLASLTFAAYVLINRYVYIQYKVNGFNYVATFMIAGGFFATAGILFEYSRNKTPVLRKSTLPVALNGIIAALGLGIFVFGQGYTTAVNAGILATSTVITTALYSRFLIGESLTRRQIIWLIVIFLGLYLAIVGTHLINFGKGEAIIIAASLVLGFTNTYSKILMRNHTSNFVADIRLVTGGLLFIALGLVIHANDFLIVSAGLWPVLSGFFFWLTIKFFYASVRYSSPSKAIVLANSHPIFTPIAGVLLLSEPYGLTKFLGAILILIGVYYFSKK